MTAPQPGTIGWIDLTVDDCEDVRSFYESVVGWKNSPVKMGDYNDYCMLPGAEADPVAGICHAKGPNVGIPAAWLIYITVEDIAAALEKCEENGGSILQKREPDSHGQMAIIKDPAGAVCALYQPAVSR